MALAAWQCRTRSFLVPGRGDGLFLILIGGVLGLVWGAVLLRRGGLLGGSLAVLLAGICFSHPFFNVPLGPIPLTLDRLLLAGLVAAAIVYRRFGWTEPKPMTPADWALGAFIAVLLASTLTHDWQVNNFQPVAQVLFFFLMPVAMYWVVRQTPVAERALEWMYLVLGLFGIYLAITSMAEVRQMWAFVFPRYIGSTEYVEFFGRGRGPLLNPAGSGILQGLCLLGMLMRWPRASRTGQLFILALLPLYAWGIYSTFTRSAWLGLALGAAGRPGLQSVARLADGRDRHAGRRLAAGGGVELGTIDELQTRQGTERGRSRRIGQAAPDLGGRRLAHVFGSAIVGLGLWAISNRKPGLLVRSLDRFAVGKSPAIRAAQRLLGAFGRYGPGWNGAVHRDAGALDADGLAIVAHSQATPAARQFGLLFLAFVGVWFPNAMFQDVLMIPMVNMLLVFLAALVVNLATVSHAAGNRAESRHRAAEQRAAAQSIMGPSHCKPEYRNRAAAPFAAWMFLWSRQLLSLAASASRAAASAAAPRVRHTMLDVCRLLAAYAIVWLHTPRRPPGPILGCWADSPSPSSPPRQRFSPGRPARG